MDVLSTNTSSQLTTDNWDLHMYMRCAAVQLVRLVSSMWARGPVGCWWVQLHVMILERTDN